MKQRLGRIARPAALVAAVGLAIGFGYSSRSQALPATTSARFDGYKISVSSPAAAPAAMQASRFVIDISGSEGAPGHAGSIRLKYWMPGMFCGVFEAEATETDRAGQYAAVVVPVMEGRWIVEASVRIDGGEYEIRHRFAVAGNP